MVSTLAAQVRAQGLVRGLGFSKGSGVVVMGLWLVREVRRGRRREAFREVCLVLQLAGPHTKMRVSFAGIALLSESSCTNSPCSTPFPVPRSPNPEEPGTPTFGSGGFGSWTRQTSQRNNSGGHHASSGGANTASAAAAVPSRGEAERISGSQWAARFKRDRAPGEGPIGPPADHSGGFGRGKRVRLTFRASSLLDRWLIICSSHTLQTERPAVHLASNRLAGAEKTSSSVSANASASRDDANASSAAAATAGGVRHYTEEDLEDEAKILDALRLEEEERQAAREVDGWSPEQSFWLYKDYEGKVQGPFVATNMQDWYSQSYFKNDLLVRREEEADFRPLGDVIKETGSTAEPFLVPPPRPQPQATGPLASDNLANGQSQANVASPWGAPQQSASLIGGFQNPSTPLSASAFQDAGQQAFGSSPFMNAPQQAQQQVNFGVPGELSLEDKLRAQEQYLFMLQRQQLIEQSLRSGAQPDQNMLAAAFGMPNLNSAQPPWANQQQPAPDAWNQPSMQYPFLQQQQAQHHYHQSAWNPASQPPADPWGAGQSAVDRQTSSVLSTDEMRGAPEAIGTPRRARSPAPQEPQASEAQPSMKEPEVAGALVSEQAKVEVEQGAGPDEEQVPSQSEASLSSLEEDEFLKHDAAGFKLDDTPAMSDAVEDPLGSGPVASPAPAKPAPWASALEEQQKQKQKQGSSGGASLREIQEAERKAAEAKKNAARAAAAAARASNPSPGGSSQPVTMSWGLASVPSSAGKVAGSGTVSSPVSASPSQPVWNTAAVTQRKKTLAEIQEEEQKRAHRAKELAAVARATTGGKGYAESAASMAAAQSPQTAAPGWNVVGSGGKPGPTTPSRPFAAVGNAPQRSVSASATVPTTRTVSAASSLASRPNGNLSRPGTAGSSSSGPSLEFIAYLKQQLKGLNVKVDDFIEMLMSFPLDPSPDVVEIIAESIYANSSTMDGRRFAEDFVAKRKMDAQGRALPTSSIAAAVGPQRSASDVLKTQPPKVEDKFSGFKVVKAKGGKKKGTK